MPRNILKYKNSSDHAYAQHLLVERGKWILNAYFDIIFLSSVYCLSQGAHVGVCLSFRKITQKVIDRFGLNFQEML